jgi:hypothetical protein
MESYLIRQTLVRDMVIDADYKWRALEIAWEAKTWSAGATVSEDYELVAEATDTIYDCGERRDLHPEYPPFKVQVRKDDEYGWVIEEVVPQLLGPSIIYRIKHDIATRDLAMIEGYAHKAELIV